MYKTVIIEGNQTNNKVNMKYLTGCVKFAMRFAVVAAMVILGLTSYGSEAYAGWGSCTTESGRASLANFGGTVTLNNPIVNVNNAFVLVKSTSADSVGNTGAFQDFATGEITDANTLTFTRVLGGGNNLEVSYQVVQCPDGEFTVQRGTIPLLGATTSNTATISSVDTSRSLVVVSSRSADTAVEQNEAWVTGELSNATTVTATRDAGGNDTNVYYEAIEFSAASGVTVQTGERTVVTTEVIGAEAVVPITPVNEANSWLYFSGACPVSGLDDCKVAGNIYNSGNELRFYHQSEGTVRARWYVVEFPAASGVSVQRGVSSYNAAVSPATHNIGITAVSGLDKAFAWSSNTTLGNGTAFPRNLWVEQLSTTSNIEEQGWNMTTANADAEFEWQVVEFPTSITDPGTTAGTASATPGNTEIVITAPYAGDNNTDNDLLIEWGLNGVNYTLGNSTRPHAASPYTYTIPSLTNGTAYQVRVTYQDTDGVLGTAVQTFTNVTPVAWSDHPLLHNSNRFSPTTKHGDDWGTSTGYAGGFVCSTCHGKHTGNIKRVVSTISFPDGSNMPNGATSTAVALNSVEDGTSELGDDSTAPRSSSNRICEVCHTYDAAQLVGTQFHAADQAGITGHFDNEDCIKCHLHKNGFAASCDDCHGGEATDTTPISSNVHSKHILTSAGNYGLSCATCHPVDHDGNVDVVFTGIGAGGTYTAATKQCSNLYCHGPNNTADWDAGTGGACGDCHGAAGTGRPNAANEPSGGSHTTTSHAAEACTVCHAHDGSNTTLHVNGPANSFGDAEVSTAGTGINVYNAPSSTLGSSPDPDGFKYGNSNCTVSCHSNATWGAAGGCNFCHGYPPNGTDAQSAPGVAVGKGVDHSALAITGSHSECNTCHGYSETNGATANQANGGDDYLASYHRDGKIEMNGWATDSGQDTQYQQTNFGCNKACHSPSNDAAHQMSDSGLTVQLHRYGSGDCTGCHDGTSGAAGSGTRVTGTSSHADSTGYTCAECHGSHGAGDVHIPNNATVGINYPAAEHNSGIALSDPVSATAKTTEAEICWACHALGGADWRTGGDYPSYTISSRDWTAASFDGPGVIPNRGVVSIHSANNVDTESPAPTTAGIGANATVRSSSVGNNWNSSNGSVNHSGLLEDVGSIRCSYCHDVHSLGANGYTPTGKPYLRGTWLSNPYPLERPPQTGDNWAGNTFGQNINFPRLLTDTNGGTAGVGTANAVGGYQIDQNNSFPTAGETVATSAGLCTLCHTNSTDTMDYYSNAATATRLWIGTNNGHANSTLGGTGTANGNNLFDARRGGPPYQMAVQNGVGQNDFGKANSEYMKSSGLYSTWRSSQPGKGNSTPPPKNTGWYGGTAKANTRGSEYNNWYSGTVTGKMSGETRAHNFSCSKCHTPHASGLPALLITNCLDRSIATWSGNLTGGGAVGPAQTTGVKNQVQNNCHRKEGSYTSGWNKMAPGQ